MGQLQLVFGLNVYSQLGDFDFLHSELCSKSLNLILEDLDDTTLFDDDLTLVLGEFDLKIFVLSCLLLNLGLQLTDLLSMLGFKSQDCGLVLLIELQNHGIVLRLHLRDLDRPA